MRSKEGFQDFKSLEAKIKTHLQTTIYIISYFSIGKLNSLQLSRKDQQKERTTSAKQAQAYYYNNEFVLMSLIIEDDIALFNHRLYLQTKTSIDKPPPIPDNQNFIINKFKYQNQLTNTNFQASAIHEFAHNSNKSLKIIISFKKKLFNAFDVWYNAKLDQNAIFIEEKLILASEELPYKITNLKKKLLALKQISRSNINSLKYSKIMITREGLIVISLPKLVLNTNVASTFRLGQNSIAKSQLFACYVENIVSFMLVDSKQTLKNMFNSATNIRIKQQNAACQAQNQNNELDMKFQLYRYLFRSPIQLRFDCTEGSALYQQVVDITNTEQKQIQDRIRFIRTANQLRLNSLSLYLIFTEMFEDKAKQAFYMTAKQKQITKNLLEIPQIMPVKHGNGSKNVIIQNKYLFNNIALELPKQNERLILLGQSGFGRIEFGSFNLWYLTSSKLEKKDLEQTLKQSNKIKNKHLIVKSPKPAFDQQGLKKYRSKQTHEIKIINRLKGLSCALIPRFYQVQRFYPQAFTQIHRQYINKYKQALLSELMCCYGEPGYHIGHIIEERWNVLTLKKIVYIMSQVAQAIRFLHLNKIVHLDLKPQNILFLKNFSIKLIDFGESFHPSVPYEESPPAYTYPYGCPEIAQQCESFPDKSDVFSFGVILYELLYGRDILTTRADTLLNQYVLGNYSKRIFFNPEELQSYGQSFVLPILNNLVIRALSPDIQSRPSITWISVLLKNFLEILQQ